MKSGKSISLVMEDYLETIAYLKEKNGFVRVSDIAQALNVKKPTVHKAVETLAEKGLVVHERYGQVSLTESGVASAADLQGKEDILFRFFTDYLFMDKATAKDEACRLEHSVSRQALVKLAALFGFIEKFFDKADKEGMRKLERYMKKAR